MSVNHEGKGQDYEKKHADGKKLRSLRKEPPDLRRGALHLSQERNRRSLRSLPLLRPRSFEDSGQRCQNSPIESLNAHSQGLKLTLKKLALRQFVAELFIIKKENGNLQKQIHRFSNQNRFLKRSFSANIHRNMTILVGRNSKALFICPIEGRILLEAALFAGIGNVLPFPNQAAGQKQAFDENVLPKSGSRCFFEAAGQLRFGKIKASGNGIQRKIGGKILIDVFNHFIILSQFIPIAEASLGADVTIGGLQ